MLYYNWILNIDDKELHENTAEASEYIICYISFRTINFPCFVLYSYPDLHVIEWYVEADF
jgi:hypothetical protein